MKELSCVVSQEERAYQTAMDKLQSKAEAIAKIRDQMLEDELSPYVTDNIMDALSNITADQADELAKEGRVGDYAEIGLRVMLIIESHCYDKAESIATEYIRFKEGVKAEADRIKGGCNR